MAKIKISKEEVKQMIKEEYFRKLTEIKLKNRLQQINEEMESIASEGMEEESLEEVEAGGTGKVRSTAWTGEKGGDEKWKPQFQKKGSHLVEDESEEIELGDEPTSDEMMDDETLEADMDIEAILAKLADAIEDKIETTVSEKMSGENSDEMPSEEMSDEEIPAEDLDSIESEEEDEEIVKEQDGTPIVNANIKTKPATPYEDKAEVPKSGQLVSESTMKRMQILSGIRKNDFND